MTKILQEEFDKAFEEFQAFGPRRRVPIEQRWRALLPNLDPSEFVGLKAHCKEIEEFAWGLAEQIAEKKIDNATALQQLEKRFPFLTRKRSGHTLGQAIYFYSK